MFPVKYKSVAEWLMALVSKTRRSNVLGGSNPPTLAGKKN